MYNNCLFVLFMVINYVQYYMYKHLLALLTHLMRITISLILILTSKTTGIWLVICNQTILPVCEK